MMRRLFFRNAAVGAAAAPIILGGASTMPDGPRVPTPAMPYRGDEFVKETTQAFDPLRAIKEAKRIDYTKSMSAIRQIQDRKYSRRYAPNQLDLNISALRSVSIQHKAIMQQNEIDNMKEEIKSWKDKLLEQFGLKREDVYDDESSAQASIY